MNNNNIKYITNNTNVFQKKKLRLKFKIKKITAIIAKLNTITIIAQKIVTGKKI